MTNGSKARKAAKAPVRKTAKAPGRQATRAPARKAPVRAPGAKAKTAPRLPAAIARDVEAVVARLRQLGSERVRAGMARFAIPSDRAFGITVATLRKEAARIGRNHALALALWDTGWYEARMLAVFIADPVRITPAQMDAWAYTFDNWAICDTACFALFDRSPFAWGRVPVWVARREEYVRRAGFALLWALAVHDRVSDDARFERALLLVERCATDERPYVNKAVDMALRAIGKRSASLNDAAIALAQRLSRLPALGPRRIGNNALRELTSASVRRRLAAKPRRPRA